MGTDGVRLRTRGGDTPVPSVSTARIVAVLGVVAVTALLGAGLAAPAAADTGSDAAYVTNGTVELVDGDGVRTDTNVNATVVGPVTDFDGDGTLGVPTVNGSGYVRIVRADGTAETLVAGDAATTSITVGDATGDGALEILYQNTSDDNRVYRVDLLGNTGQLTDAGTNGVVGYGDFDVDGDDEPVFLGTSNGIKYLDNGSVVDTGYSDVGTNEGIGVGPLVDFDLDGTPRVAVVDSSSDIALVNHTGHGETVTGSYGRAAKASLGAVDRRSDGAREVVHVRTDGELALAEVDGTTYTVRDDTGDPIPADTGVGASGRLSFDRSPPVIEIVKPTERTYLSDSVPLNVTANEPIDSWSYSLDGGPNQTFEPNTTIDSLDPGQYEITVYATDEAGNDVRDNRTFAVGEPASILVFVDNGTGKLSYLTGDGEVVRTSVVSDDDELKAAGPAVHYDADGRLEIPYIKPDGQNDPALYLYHLANGSSTVLDPDVIGEVNRGKLSLADWDDDRRLDVVYPGQSGELMRADADEGPTVIVSGDTSTNGNSVDPQGIFGSVDIGYNENTTDREIVWLDAGSNVKAVSKSDPKTVESVSFDQTPGTNNNVGAGEPLPLSADGPKYFPIIDGSGHPGLLNASDRSHVILNDSSRDEHASTKSPVGLGDMTGNDRKELVFADTEGVLKYTTTYLEQAPDNPISTLTVDGDPVTVSRHHGILSTHFPERVEGEFRYGGDSTPPDVTIVEPTPDGHTAGLVPLSVTADEPVIDWSYSLDDGPRRSFTPNTSIAVEAGTHSVTVYATDRAGNVDSTTRTFEVDRRPSTDDPTATPSPTPGPPPSVDTPTPTPPPTGTVTTPTPTVVPPTGSPTPTASPTPNETASPTPYTGDRGVFTFLGGGFNWWLLLLLFATMVVLAVLEIHLIDQQD
jgi:hypothetical protein